jgi:hypothetical protein
VRHRGAPTGLDSAVQANMEDIRAVLQDEHGGSAQYDRSPSVGESTNGQLDLGDIRHDAKLFGRYGNANE